MFACVRCQSEGLDKQPILDVALFHCLLKKLCNYILAVLMALSQVKIGIHE